VPADARLVDSRGLLVNESILTGEPEAIAKAVASSEHEDRPTPVTAVYAGTTVVAGSGTALAVATGPSTTLGSIFAAVEGAERRATPLEERLEQLGNRLIVVFLVLCGIVAGLGLLQRRDGRLVIEMTVSLAIGAVPEGLPAVATAALAVAVRRLATLQVLVRHLAAVETLGSATVIVADKTGTLTENRMVVRQVLLADGHACHVSVSTAPGGALRTQVMDAAGGPVPVESQATAERLLLLAALCNDAVAEYDEASDWHTHGDPSEAALVLAATGLTYDLTYRNDQFPRVFTEPFTSARRLMRTVHGTPDGSRLTAIKGAYREVATLAGEASPTLERAVQALGEEGYRVFAVAEAIDDAPVRLAGAVVLEDPLRPDAAQAAADCRALGLRLLLATGDQLTTATRIGQQTGILAAGERAVNGRDLDVEHLDGVAVIARATHHQKAAVVQALQRRGDVVAMTGDGVNDAAALRAADVGLAVGPNASDVAVEAADIVLSDGRLASLVQGIAAGRQVTQSLRAGILYLFTASFGTILLVTLSLAASRPIPLSPLQILWLNLVVHVFPALALATGHEAAPAMRGPTRVLLNNATWAGIGWRALLVALAGIAVLLRSEAIGETLAHAQTLVFITLALGLVGQVFLIEVWSTQQQWARLRRRALWLAAGTSVTLLLVALYLPGLHGVLGLQLPGVTDWAVALACALGAWLLGQAGVVLGARLLRRVASDRANPQHQT
jgi:P-type Ca2+ transporter type 2C